MSMGSEDVSAFLHENDVDGELMHLTQHTATVEAAAEALGVSSDSIVKSVVLLADSSPVLVIASGPARVDFKAVADYLGWLRSR